MIFANKTVGEVYNYTFKLLTAENDRGAVLLGGVLTDAILDEMIKIKLVSLPYKKDKSREGFQYAKKIDMAFRLGLISKEMFDLLHALRDARNKFAHRVVSDLEDVTISSHISEIFDSIPDFYRNFMSGWIKNLRGVVQKVGITDENLLNSISPNARTRFDNYLTVIISILYQELEKIEPISAKSGI